MEQVAWPYLYIYINAVANSVMLLLYQDFYNIILKKELLAVASGVAFPPNEKF